MEKKPLRGSLGWLFVFKGNKAPTLVSLGLD